MNFLYARADRESLLEIFRSFGRETIVRAGQWITRTLLEIDQKELIETYGPYSHAARALCLWRSVEPMEAWKTGRK